MTDPFLKLLSDIQRIWDYKKSLVYCTERSKVQIIKNLEKFVSELGKRTPMLLKEIELLKEINKIQ